MRRLLLSLALLLTLGSSHVWAASCSTTAVGTFTCKQSKAIANASSATPTMAMPSSLTAGGILLGGISWQSSSITLNSISASSGCTGITWTIVDNPTKSIESSAGFYGTGYSSGACTIQWNLSGAAITTVGVHEVLGGDTVTPIGTQHAAVAFDNQATATHLQTASVTASSTDYLFSFWGELSNGNTATAGTGYTRRETGANISGGWATEDKSSTGSNVGDWTTSAGGNYGGIIVLDLAPSGGGSPACTDSHMLGVWRCDEER